MVPLETIWEDASSHIVALIFVFHFLEKLRYSHFYVELKIKLGIPAWCDIFVLHCKTINRRRLLLMCVYFLENWKSENKKSCQYFFNFREKNFLLCALRTYINKIHRKNRTFFEMSTNCAFHLCYLYIFQFLLERYIILEFFSFNFDVNFFSILFIKDKNSSFLLSKKSIEITQPKWIWLKQFFFLVMLTIN